MLLFHTLIVMAQTTITGVVTERHQPVPGTNVFIVGTIDGCMTDSLGRFSFTTYTTGEQTLRACLIGYDEYNVTADVSSMNGLNISLHEKATNIDELVVTASTYSIGKGDNFHTMNALDVVMSPNSNGDLVAALQSLPGTQKVGENGKLYVRGGDDSECHTFINGMHVLMPYTTNVANSSSRGRFSPFLFKGINFSLGGYNGEYGNALSSVLPMETTDMVTSDKLGISASLLDWSIGGTKAFQSSSLSFNANYTNLGLHKSLMPDNVQWTRPYGMLALETQYKKEINQYTTLKTYIGYDNTSVGIEEPITLMSEESIKKLDLHEHNAYANITMKSNIGSGWSLFAGLANSTIISDINDALVPNDHYHKIRNEIHAKSTIRKVFCNAFKATAGMEDYQHNGRLRYEGEGYDTNYNMFATFIDGNLRLANHLFANMSARAELQSYNNQWVFMPRTTLSYIPDKKLQFSASYGRYSQSADDEYIALSGNTLSQSTATHTTLSMQYNGEGTLLRLEPYIKHYDKLPLLQGSTYSNLGYGTSKGLDFFCENHSLIRNITTTLSYSFNDSKRLYKDYSCLRTPEYASRHNIRLSVRYSIGKFNLGLADSYASGRHYEQGTTPHYNSVDMSVTWLPNPKIIVYSSCNNIFGRNNIFGYDKSGKAITATHNRFFYIAIFVSLFNNKAYEISNF